MSTQPIRSQPPPAATTRAFPPLFILHVTSALTLHLHSVVPEPWDGGKGGREGRRCVEGGHLLNSTIDRDKHHHYETISGSLDVSITQGASHHTENGHRAKCHTQRSFVFTSLTMPLCIEHTYIYIYVCMYKCTCMYAYVQMYGCTVCKQHNGMDVGECDSRLV